MSLVTCQLMGGFANNLFQIAASYGYAKEYSCDWYIPEWIYAPYLNYNFPQARITGISQFKEPHFHYSPITGNDIELYGYFQSEKYFSNCKEEIIELFQPIDELKKLIPKFKGHTCAIHVRRGDYLTLSDYHFNLQLDYYDAAMKLMGNKQFIVFSDDIDWCKEQSLFEDCGIYHNSGDGTIVWKDLIDFYVMASCKNHIIANSSFSWWASYLSGSENIIAPKNWFGIKSTNDTKDLYTDKMTVI